MKLEGALGFGSLGLYGFGGETAFKKFSVAVSRSQGCSIASDTPLYILSSLHHKIHKIHTEIPTLSYTLAVSGFVDDDSKLVYCSHFIVLASLCRCLLSFAERVIPGFRGQGSVKGKGRVSCLVSPWSTCD